MDIQGYWDEYIHYQEQVCNCRSQEDDSNHGIVSAELRAQRAAEDIHDAAILVLRLTGYHPQVPQAPQVSPQVQDMAAPPPLLQAVELPVQKTALLKDVKMEEQIIEFKDSFYVVRCPLCWSLPKDKQPHTFAKGPMTTVASMFAHLNQSTNGAHQELLVPERTSARAAVVAGLLVTDATEGSVDAHIRTERLWMAL